MTPKLLALATAALLIPAAAAGATVTTVYSPSNVILASPDNADLALEEVDGLTCPKPATLPKPAGRAAAIRRAWKALGRLERPGALRAFRASPANRVASVIPGSVVAGVATGRPGAALAASLRGAELEPRQQRHLVNAAVLLLGYGKVREANDLLAAAKRLAASGAPFGIGGAAAFAAAQGEVALASGKYASAERSYRSAARQAPLLAEARLGVAHALKCQRKRGPAARWRRRGQRRIDKTEPGTGADPEPAVTVDDLVDPAAERDIVRFGDYYHPDGPVDAALHEAAYRRADEDAQARGLALHRQYEAAIDAAGSSWSTQTLLAWSSYFGERLKADPELKRLNAESDRLAAEWNDLTALGDARQACDWVNRHTQIWALHQRREANLEAIARRYHRVATALGAAVANPDASRAYNLSADEYAADLYASLMQLVYYTAQGEASDIGITLPPPEWGCGAAGSGGGGTGKDVPEDTSPKSDPCTAAKIERLKIKLGATASAEFSCEGGKIELVPVKWGPDQAYIGAFVEGGVKWKNGDVTAVTGVKAAIGTKGIPGLPTVGVGSKIGAYVTAGRVADKGLPEYGTGKTSTWTVKDWGVRVQSTAEIPGPGIGSVTTITKFDDKTDISLVGVFGGSK